MSIALLTNDARAALLLVALGFAALALFLRWRKAREGWLVATTMLAGSAALALVGERVVGLVVALAAPDGIDFNEFRWVLLGPWGRLGLAAGALATAVVIVLSVLGTSRERRPWRRGLLIGLRSGAALACLVVFLQPALELRHVMREPNHVAILVDDSRSMDLAEQAHGETRAERAAQLIAGSEATFRSWRERHILDFYTFSDAIQPASPAALTAPAPTRADATLLREALEQVRARYEENDLAGIVVVSDGIATGRFAEGAADGPARDFLTGLGTRVHTAWVGRAGLVDLSIARVNADEFAFVRTVVKVEATVRATGLPRREVPVVLRQGGKVVRQATVQVGGDTPEARVTFEFTPERIGKYVYEFSVPVDPAEAVTGNNARAFVLHVIRDKVRVLQVSGRPSWDERALRGWLKSDPNVDLISFFILRTPDDIQMVDQSEMSLIPFPTEELFEHELGSFDVIVLQNFEYGRYGIGPYLENIRQYVERGGALAMIGGDLAFSSGGYQQTELAPVLPVELLPERDPGRLISSEEFHPRLTAEGLRHPVTRLRFDARDNEARWNALPPLEGVNLVAGAKPGATVLMAHPWLKARGGRPLPVLTVGEYGQGRSLALTTDTAWRWGFWAAGLAGDDGRSFQKFWENAIRWLIRDPELQILHIESDQAAYAPGEAPRLSAHLVDRDYQPAHGAEITLTITRGVDDPAKKVLTKKIKTDENGDARLDLKPPGPGAYRVEAKAQVGDVVVSADDVFLVDPERAELEQPAAREDVLRGISEATGGRYLGQASSLPSDLALLPPRIVRVDRRTDVELWSRPYLLLLALAFLGAEWALRRRSGYV